MKSTLTVTSSRSRAPAAARAASTPSGIPSRTAIAMPRALSVMVTSEPPRDLVQDRVVRDDRSAEVPVRDPADPRPVLDRDGVVELVPRLDRRDRRGRGRVILEQRRDGPARRRMGHAERRDGDDERERDEDQQPSPRRSGRATRDDPRSRSGTGAAPREAAPVPWLSATSPKPRLRPTWRPGAAARSGCSRTGRSTT